MLLINIHYLIGFAFECENINEDISVDVPTATVQNLPISQVDVTVPRVEENRSDYEYNKKFKQSTAKRLSDSLIVGKDICDIRQKKIMLKQNYYEKSYY